MMTEADERRRWFREAVLPLRGRLHRAASRFCRNRPAEADDLVQETFIRLYGYADWRGINNVEGFALRTLNHLGLDHLRRQRVVPLAALDEARAAEVVDDHPSAERVITAREELHLLAQLIGKLPPQCRRVFTLCKIYGLTHEEIAVRLGLSVSTVEKHVAKGLRLCSEGLASSPAVAQRGRPLRSRSGT